MDFARETVRDEGPEALQRTPVRAVKTDLVNAESYEFGQVHHFGYVEESFICRALPLYCFNTSSCDSYRWLE